jgi:nucleotide-binding universal stress UspA family protein
MILPKIAVKRILFATDLSENARQALAYAVSLANLYKAGIVIVHAMEDSPGMDAAIGSHLGQERWAQIQRENEQAARETIIGKRRDENPEVKEALKTIFRDATADMENQSFLLEDMVVKRGLPVDVILEAVEVFHCDLIVIGTQSRGGFQQMVMGSTAQKVLKRSRVPVLVVPLVE